VSTTIFRPTSQGADSNMTAVGLVDGSQQWDALNEDPRWPALDLDSHDGWTTYLSATVAITTPSSFIFSDLWHPTNFAFGTPAGFSAPLISSLTFTVVASHGLALGDASQRGLLGQTRPLTLHVRRAGVSTDIGSITITSTGANPSNDSMRPYTSVSTLDPVTGLAWAGSDLLSGSLEFGIRGAAGLIGVSVSQLFVAFAGTWSENFHLPGSGVFHRGPAMHDTVHIDSISGIPYHRSDLAQVNDPRHPHYGLLLRPEELDDINPEPTEPRFVEGDLEGHDA